MSKTPFRKCDYCGSTQDSPRRDRLARRAWTVFSHSRKIACPDCQPEGRVEDTHVHLLVLRYGTLMSHRLLAEPMALYGMEHDQGVVAEPVEQYRRIKPQYRDALLVLRDHQGFLMLYRDAQQAARILGVEYPGNGAFRIAKSMLEHVLNELVKCGHRVAVVVDPVVDDPRNARQSDLWDEIPQEETLVGEPVPNAL